MSKLIKHTVKIHDEDVTYYDVGEHGNRNKYYLQAGLHGNELFSSMVLLELLRLLEKESLDFFVRIVPFCNPFSHKSYLSGKSGRISENSGKDWNRIFNDDNPRNSIEDELSKSLISISSDFNLIFDVHTPEYGMPHLYVPYGTSYTNTFSDIPHVISDDVTTGAFEDRHSELNNPAVTIELPSINIATERDVLKWARRIYSELISHCLPKNRTKKPENIGYMKNVYTNVDGIYYISSKPGEVVCADEVICYTVGISGQLERLSYPKDSIPLCFRRSGTSIKGEWVVRVLELI